MSVIDFEILYISNPDKAGPLADGKLYVGEPDLEPIANPKQLNVVQGDGTVVPISQPMVLSAGGNPVYNGSTVRLDVDGNYSIKILDKNDNQKYYIDNVFEGQSITAEDGGEFFTRKFDTLALAVASTKIQDGDALNIKEHTTGNGGGSKWNVVTTGTTKYVDLPDTIGVVACTGVPGLSVVIQVDDHVYPDRFGAKFDYVTGAPTDEATDDSEILAYCHLYGHDNKHAIVYPNNREAVVSPTFGTSDESTLNVGTSIKVCFDILDNQVIVFNGSTLKVADGVSSNAAPVDYRVFFSNTPKTNVYHDGGTIDLNGDNNLHNGVAAPLTQNKTQFAFGYSGTQGGVAARGDNHRLTDMKYINTAGVTFVAGGQTNTVGTQMGKNWYINNCEFRNGGIDSSDHSSLFAWFQDSEITNNTFDMPLPFNTTTDRGGLVACELHGSDLLFHGNYINNYFQGIWLSSNNSDVQTRGFVVTGNRAKVGQTFCDFYSRNIGTPPTTVSDSFVYDSVIANNHITMQDVNASEPVRGVFQITASRGVRNVKICDNVCIVEGTQADTVMVRITVLANAYEPHDQIAISNNTCAGGLTTGVTVFWESVSTIGRVSIKDNDFGTYVTPAVLVNKDLYMFGSAAGSIDTLDVDFRDTTESNILTDWTLYSSTHDGAGNAAILSDSTANFTNTVMGRTLFNVTDGSSGTVTAFTSTTITATLSGGTDDDWDASDAYTLDSGYRAKVRGNANLNIEPTLTNITQGNGTHTYKTFLDNHSGMVNIASMFTLGSTSSVDGAVSIGISEVSSSFASIGMGAAIRGAAMYPLVANNDVTGSNFSLNDSGGACDATNPITFTTADVIKLTASYYADFVSL